MMRKVREKIMSALVVLCMILACTNSIVAKEVTISGFVEQLDIADETTLSNYFQNRAENFYGNTVESGWIKEEQQQRILGIWRGNPRPFNDRDESAACFYHAINLPKA